jgi:hypothetical protein
MDAVAMLMVRRPFNFMIAEWLSCYSFVPTSYSGDMRMKQISLACLLFNLPTQGR